MGLVNPIVRRWIEDAASDPDAFRAHAAEQVPWFVEEARLARSRMSADVAEPRR